MIKKEYLKELQQRQLQNRTKAVELNKQATEANLWADIKDPTKENAPALTQDPGYTAENFQNPGGTLSIPTNTATAIDNSSVSVPSYGVGEGPRLSVGNGNAKENITSPTAPMNKLSAQTDSILARLNKFKSSMSDGQQKQAQAQAQASLLSPTIPSGILAKLASDIEHAKAIEEGKQLTSEVLAKEAGMREVANLLADVRGESAQYNQAAQQEVFYKKASIDKLAAHNTWLDQLPTDIEKRAYTAGADDAAALAEQGAIPGDPGDTDMPTEEDVLQAVAEAVRSGQLTEEGAQAALQEMNADGDVGGDFEQIITELETAVQAGVLSQEAAVAIAQSIKASFMEDEGVEAQPEMSPEEAAAIAAEVQAAQGDPAVAEAMGKAASVLQSLLF